MGNCYNSPGIYDDNALSSTLNIQNDNRISTPTFKVVLMGNKAVGKTCIVGRFVKNIFDSTHTLTIGAAFVSKIMNLKVLTSKLTKIPSTLSTYKIKCNIWDTAGEEAYKSMTRFFFREAHAAIAVYDVTDMASFNDMNGWIKDFYKECGSSNTVVVVAGNKCDMESQRKVSKEMVQSYIEAASSEFKTANITAIECSAKLGLNTTYLFEEIVSILVKKFPEMTPDSTATYAVSASD